MNFEKIVNKVIQNEGGYVNDPDDPGGETKYGISKKYHPSEDIFNLTKTRAKEIYYAKYWIPSRCSDLPENIRYLHMDTAVHMGNVTAIKLLQKTIGVKIDGVFGEKTKRAAVDANIYVYAYHKMIAYLVRVLKEPKKSKYLEGWLIRLKKVTEYRP